MKKVLSMMAAAIMCAFMLVSCGVSSSYQNEMLALNDAAIKHDANGMLSNAKVILNGQDKATANDLITASYCAYQAIVQINEEGGQMNIEEALDFCKKIVSANEKGKSLDPQFYEEQNQKLKTIIGSSIDEYTALVKNDWIPKYENILAGNTTVNDGSEEGNAEAEDEGDDEEYSDDEEE